MTDLITRLREAIDEDERLARAAVRFGGPPPPHMDGPGVWFAVGMESQYDASVDEHIARHDPARVLREVAAYRKLLQEHPVQTRKGWQGGTEYGCHCSHWCETGGDLTWSATIECEIFQALAAIYGIGAGDE